LGLERKQKFERCGVGYVRKKWMSTGAGLAGDGGSASLAPVSEKVIPRGIMLPPQGRPRWMPRDPAGWELLYLSWGLRWMGEHPIPLARHEGWVYAVIVEGAPNLLINERKCATRRGDVFIFHPDCAYGWHDKAHRPSRLLTWLWRTPPAHSRLVPASGGFRQLRVGEQALRRLLTINRDCLRAVGSAGELAALELRRAHLDLDLCLAADLDRAEPANRQYRANLAVHYLRHNPGALKPAQCLCEYLQISPAALRELFQVHHGRSPQAVALELRMQHARSQLAHGAAVKQVAAELGYRHANDFSRAYKRHFKANARAAQKAG
jgi:AraC-like DNA-binding protein